MRWLRGLSLATVDFSRRALTATVVLCYGRACLPTRALDG